VIKAHSVTSMRWPLILRSELSIMKVAAVVSAQEGKGNHGWRQSKKAQT